ncbi:TRC40/GET3/ArsA family transport-energizing ATPase [Tissierella sp. MSJ-40]|jgi:arsenite-transporting ATPase|uniref:TRC40/GET3/ArsA family transport-energizing ATPase n=1 Tax=Tissierella simiarum TaxID=2841534 RepID=A0ABS6EA19_9FIRM|nr:TRC40/GET3/ArsA family transport-energizing ATPase [Tissierella simiarum]MBU5439783.1 TRC40/GET3/ArsA family transport-energizing ATPase [Tissierella simiarum]
METKFIFFSGKGGVGKTSMACTTGVYHADLGRKTLIVTTDPAANLSDVFEQEIGHKVTKIDGIDNLYAMEINPDKATDEYKERSLAPMRELFDEEMLKIAEEQLSGPCTEEMASFDKFIDFMEDDSYDIIIFDTAPTGHTIRLLELPVDWSKHIEESSQGSGQTCLGPVALIQDSKKKYDDAVSKLRDPNKTEFIFVMQPEQTSLDETIRSSNELKEIGINTTSLIVNGFIPKQEAINPFFKSRYDMQQKYLEETKSVFKDISITTMELFDSELKGIEMLRKSGEKLFEKEKSNNIGKLIYPKENKRKNIFFSGKGGVGKTSMACITAVQTAKKGFKTLLMTTDPAAHIGNVLDKPVSDEITKIDGVNNLYAVKIDQKKATEDYKNSILDEAKGKFGEDTIKAMEEELNSPCTEEMAAFQKFIQYASGDEFDIIVFDTAPTGHTLRLLELPMDWSKQIQLKAGISTGISDADKLQKERFDKVMDMMKNEDETTFSFVMYPEKTPMIEAYRASKELEEFGIKTQLVSINLIIPEEQAQSPFFKKRRDMQLAYIEEIKEKFENANILTIPMFDKEIKGIDMLEQISEVVFEEEI